MAPVNVAWVVSFLALVALVSWHYRRAAALLRRWAVDNGYHVVHSEFRLLFGGGPGPALPGTSACAAGPRGPPA
jgi:hypothetical protein